MDAEVKLAVGVNTYTKAQNSTGRFWRGRRKHLRVLSMAAAIGILALHVWLRLSVLSECPTAALGSQYPHCYSTALSVLAGRGCQRLPIAEDGASQPVRAFLDLQRDGISQEEFNAYLQSIPRQTESDIGNYPLTDVTRILDLRTAAVVWRVVGISWRKLQLFYALVSTLACLAVMATAWRIARSAPATLVAGLIFACAAQEGVAGVFNMRDTNPLWFAAFSLVTTVCLAGQFRSTWANCVSFAVLGVVATIGIGWRMDNLVYAPFFILTATVQLALRRIGWMPCVKSFACAVAASASVHALVQKSHDLPRISAGIGFHMALHGEYARSNMLGVENGQQIFFDDAKVAADAFAWRDLNHADRPIQYCDRNYGDICFEMYLANLRYNAFRWLLGTPIVAKTILSGGPRPLVNWPANVPVVINELSWGGALRRIMACLFLVGLMSVCDRSFDRGGVAIVVAFLLMYSAIWFAIWPGYRHIAPLLLPFCLLVGWSITVVCRLAWRVLVLRWRPVLPRCFFLRAGISGLAIAMLFLAVVGLVYYISARERAGYLTDIRKLSQQGVEWSQSIHSQRRFVVQDFSGLPFHTGYLLELETSPDGGEILCRQARLTDRQLVVDGGWHGSGNARDLFTWFREVLWWNSFGETRHCLQAGGQKNYFFVTACRAEQGGDRRGFCLEVEALGDVRIVAAKRVNLTDWKRMQLNTVYQEGELFGVAKRIGGDTTRSLIQFPASGEKLTELGFENGDDLARIANQSTVVR